MEELSADDLQQLEEQLYSQIHHSNSLETQNTTTEDETQNQTKNIENLETANTSKFLAKRYWTNKVGIESAGGANIEVQNKFNKPNNNIKSTPPPPQKKPQDAVKPTQHNPQNNNNNNSKNKKIRNPFAQPQGAAHHNKHGAPQTKQHNRFGNPLAEKMQKIQRISQFHNKKQKADNARAKSLVKPKVVETISLDDEDDDNDEVVVVPSPPVPVFSIEDSDEEMPATIEGTITPTKALPGNSSRCASPASVISHDDFIGQGDQHRLLNVSSNTADSFLAQESRSNDDDVECIGTFVKPQASIMKTKDKVPGKQDYRVGGAEFRAVDVYESESDIVSDGVYSKGSTKIPITANTLTQNVSDNSEEDDDLDDISQNPTKTKRLRKRRASTTQRSAELTLDSDDNDGVIESGVPFIYRGQALENQKSKKKRKRLSTGRMSDSEFVATLNSLAKGDEKINAVVNSESDSRDNDQMPTARDIAEQVLNAAQSSSRFEPEIIEIPSTSTAAAAALQADEAIPADAAEDVERILSKITEFQQKKSQAEDALHADSEEEPNVSAESHILAASDVSTTVVDFDRSTLETKEENSDDDEKLKYYIGYSPANNECISDGFGWNEEMRRFYNYTWGGEYFREETVFRSMKRNPHLWRISNVDRFPMQTRGKREKCMNCFTFGHSRSKCPKPKRPLVCFMCGQSGHLEPRCPNTRCLRCGSETMSFVPSCKKCMYWNNRICPICKLRGHSLNDCPDKWRRYHSTTKPNEFPNPNVVYKRRVCCFCGKFGHLSEECRQAVHRTEYPLIASEIKSFEKSYDDVLHRSTYPAPGLQCRLLFDPKLIVNFTLAEKTTRFQVYGRFLKHVGLGRLIGVKNDNSRQNIISPTAVVVTGQKSSQKRPLFVETAQANTTNGLTQETNLANKSANKATATVTTNTPQAASTSTANMPPPPAPLLPSPMDFDSDSNYSFSEHFEVSSTQKDPQPTMAIPKPPTLEPMPDFIPLGGGDRYKATTEDTVETGISTRFVEAHSDDDDDTGRVAADVSCVSNKQKPCQAKIFIDNERYRYFQSNEGQVYLCKVLPEHELTGSLEKTSAGFALFLTGLPKNQEKFQQALLQKYEELNNAKQQQQIDMQVPKNVPALIRFLRDSINQLYSNLGSATDLYKRLYDLEKLQTKVSSKSADRVRRTLNMIFLGQAGLLNGDAHFGTLLKALNTLLCDFQSSEKTPHKMREEINASWRMLFTPYDHKRYANLLATYIQLPPMKRNRLPALQIDAKVLGNSVLDVTLTKEQKKRLASNAQIKTETATAAEQESMMDNSMLLLNVFVPGQGDDNPNSNQTNNAEANAENVPTSPNPTQHAASEEQQQTEITNKQSTNETNLNSPHSNEPSNSQNTASPAGKEVPSSSAMDHPFCLVLLGEIEKSLKIHETGARVEAAKAPSRFWSCKTQEYLLEIIEFARISNSQNLDRLEEIYKHAAAGKLSFTNHGDVLKIFNRTVKK